VIGHLTLGSLVIAIAVFIQAEMFSLMTARFEQLVRLSRRYLRRFANTGAMIAAVLFVLLVQTSLNQRFTSRSSPTPPSALAISRWVPIGGCCRASPPRTAS
jgi:hypothetical protein